MDGIIAKPPCNCWSPVRPGVAWIRSGDLAIPAEHPEIDGDVPSARSGGGPEILPYLHISLFGTFQVTVRGRQAVPIESDKAQALLAYLALEADQRHRRDTLAALFWPEADDGKARQSLRQALYVLRQALAHSATSPPEATNGSLFETSRQYIRLPANDHHWLDVTAFTALLESCRAHPHQRLEACPHCAARLQCAVDLYRGDLLAGLSLADCPAFEEW